jgi:hypothetical protein
MRDRRWVIVSGALFEKILRHEDDQAVDTGNEKTIFANLISISFMDQRVNATTIGVSLAHPFELNKKPKIK